MRYIIKLTCVFLSIFFHISIQNTTTYSRMNKILQYNQTNLLNDYKKKSYYSLIKSKWIKLNFERENESSLINNGSHTLLVPYTHMLSFIKDNILVMSSRVKELKKNKKNGLGMISASIEIFFLDLILFYLTFKLIGKISVSFSTNRIIKASGITKEEFKKINLPTGEIFAAIAMAIYEATEMHDEENTIVTIKNTARNYSPWNSKIYTLRETPNKK